jgi:hypothetical protein
MRHHLALVISFPRKCRESADVSPFGVNNSHDVCGNSRLFSKQILAMYPLVIEK